VDLADLLIKRLIKIFYGDFILYRGCEIEMTLLTAEEKELLARAASLMDELLETLKVMKDNELIEDLRAALREVEEGKARPLDELIRELGLEGKI
jgi:hypothetical protein